MSLAWSAPLAALRAEGPQCLAHPTGRQASCLRGGGRAFREGGRPFRPWLGRLLGSTLCTQQGRLTFPHKQLLAALRELAARAAPLSHAGPYFLGGLGSWRGK